jgi:aminopeptidase N
MATASIDERMLDTLTVTPDTGGTLRVPVYRAAATKKVDLHHTQLKLLFDWDDQAVHGEAIVQMKPVFYPQDSVILDAVGFDIYSVTSMNVKDTLDYTYDGSKLSIALGKTYKKGQTITTIINYSAFPNANELGGSGAITSNKGLFFIDPLDTDPDKPSQIWTQGETEHNSRWFPTIDKPNQRCTQDMMLIVDTSYVTLSNGIMTSSVVNNNGTRTDRWVMSEPHAPYLFMVAVGDFAVVSETWKDKPVDYYVEHDYEPYAKEIFNHTPEMLTFFSEILDYEYPWQKYAQIVTRDYVSGAMENTTAVIFGEFVQKTDRQLIDNHNDLIVAHEMFHHWFGDLVTCESWSNLTLNEGFANYSEYLWLEHKYGQDHAEEHRHNERDNYFSSAAMQGVHPLIHYSYDDKEDMFDAHSYNKGGLVLHMLRDYIGDEAFFASLNKYLVDNAYTAVEVDELRLAFEDVTGMDLQWFFDQWYLTQGHPVLDVSYGANEDLGYYSVVVSQTQDEETVLPVFRLPLDLALYEEDGTKHIYEVEMTQRDQLFLLRVDYPVAFATVDDDYTVLAEINEPEKTTDEYASQVKYDDNYTYRTTAYQAIEGTAPYYDLADMLVQDDFETYRMMGLEALDLNDKSNVATLAKMVTDDPHSYVRAAALSQLGEADYDQITTLAQKVIDKEQAYPPLEEALMLISEDDNNKALATVKAMAAADRKIMATTVGQVYGATGDADYIDDLESMIKGTSIYEGYPLYASYTDLVTQQDAETVMQAVKFLEPLVGSDQLYVRYAAVESLAKIRDHIRPISEAAGEEEAASNYITQIEGLIKSAIANETNQGMKRAMANF